jgi:prepilin-type N-terminal cleavage/methylation domain-containing protein
MTGSRASRGFTLIELMICLAIMAIVMSAGAFTWNRSLAWFNQEHDYALALEMARSAMDDLRHRPFESLPPHVVPHHALAAWQAPSGNRVLVGTRRVRPLPGCASYLVDYDFEVHASTGECARVPRQAPYRLRLQNEPVRQVLEVMRLDGPAPVRVAATQAAPFVVVGPGAAGAVLRVSYLGAVRIVADGRFLDADLHETEVPGPAKLIRLHVRHGAEQQGALDLVMVRMR